jgi:hypothetical protein
VLATKRLKRGAAPDGIAKIVGIEKRLADGGREKADEQVARFK